MIDCMMPEIRDSLPDLLHSRLPAFERIALTAHVEGCESCSADLALLRNVAVTAPLAPAMDVDRIVAGLPRTAGTLSLSTSASPMLIRQTSATIAKQGNFSRLMIFGSIAAVLAVAVGGLAIATGDSGADRQVATSTRQAVRTATETSGSSDAGESRVTVGAPAEQDSSMGLPDDVTASAGQSASGISTALTEPSPLTIAGSVGDLSDAHIERLLRELENMEGLPSAEPESVTSTLESLEGIE